MEVLNIAEVLQTGGGDVSGLGPYTPTQNPDLPNYNLERFIEWKMMNPGYPYDQPVDPLWGAGQ